VQSDHVHLLVKVPPKLAISELMGVLKGRTAIRLFNVFPYMRKKSYWGNHFWAKGYCVDTVGLDSEMVQKYVRYQEKEELHQQQLQFERESEPSRRGASVLPSGEQKAKPRSMNAVFYFFACQRNRRCRRSSGAI
jgi:putative transposase